MFQVTGSDKATQKQTHIQLQGGSNKIYFRWSTKNFETFSVIFQKKIWKISNFILNWWKFCLNLGVKHMLQCFTSSNLPVHMFLIKTWNAWKILSVLAYSFCQQQPSLLWQKHIEWWNFYFTNHMTTLAEDIFLNGHH